MEDVTVTTIMGLVPKEHTNIYSVQMHKCK